jgi:uncharacterized protein YndB with AHSA1/START domain
MSPAATKVDAREIVVEEVLPHAPETIWKTLTAGELTDRWLMKSTGFAAVKGTRFSFQAKPAGESDGIVHCEVLEVVPNERLSYSWRGGDDRNAQYGSNLDTIVTWTLTRVEGGTRLRLVHSGFVLPKNHTAYWAMGEGWKKIVSRIGNISGADVQ